MAVALEQVIGYVSLLGLIERIKSGIPNPLPEQFFSLVNNDPVGDSGKYTRVTGTRTLAKHVMYGAPAVRRALKGIEDIPVKLIHSYEEISFNPLVLIQLRAYEKYVNDRGKQEVARQVKEFVMNFTNSRIHAVQSMLANGKIWVDSSGNPLPTSSGASRTIDYGMSANNQNQLNGLIDTPWSDTSANIPTQMALLQERSLQATGYPLEIAFYGRNVPSYFATNDYVQEYLARNQQMNNEWLTAAGGKKLGGVVPQGMFGIKNWVPINTGFFEDSSGTNQSIWNADAVTFTPEISSDWYEMLQGEYPVPKSIDIQSSAEQAMRDLEIVKGMFAYAKVLHNPVSITMFHGDTYLPVLKVVDAVYQAIVANY